MKILFDYLAIAVFFISYLITKDIFFATKILIIATIVQVLGVRYITGKWEKMHVIGMFFVLFLGGLTLVSQDDRFIKWKPSVVNWLFASILLASHYIGRTHLIKRFLANKISLPDVVWRNVSYMWIAFFIFSGCLNLYVAYGYSQEAWVYFKMFGSLIISIIFMLLQFAYIAKYLFKKSNES